LYFWHVILSTNATGLVTMDQKCRHCLGQLAHWQGIMVRFPQRKSGQSGLTGPVMNFEVCPTD
ncbi:MAG: hypothetical protein OXF46_02385, partial [Rhodobacteraceae bacterium]|nr:hypothetical protein [Paracoccaceae bacterium]